MLKNKSANSEGIAKTFSFLLKKMGVESSVIDGNYMENNVNMKHYWNTLTYKDEVYNYDASLDASVMKANRVWKGILSDEFEKTHTTIPIEAKLKSKTGK